MIPSTPPEWPEVKTLLFELQGIDQINIEAVSQEKQRTLEELEVTQTIRKRLESYQKNMAGSTFLDTEA